MKAVATMALMMGVDTTTWPGMTAESAAAPVVKGFASSAAVTLTSRSGEVGDNSAAYRAATTPGPLTPHVMERVLEEESTPLDAAAVGRISHCPAVAFHPLHWGTYARTGQL